MTAMPLTRCRDRRNGFLRDRLAPRGRRERRHGGTVDGRGLLLDGERKSAGAMADRWPDGNEQHRQQFLNQSPWDGKPLWRQMARRVGRQFPRPLAWMVDDTSFPKKGSHSVGVHRQYSETRGKTANCPVAVSLHHSDARGSSPPGFALSLPAAWTSDRERCQKAGVPADVAFRKKWALALDLVDAARAAGAPRPEAVLADCGYGDNGAFGRGLDERGLAYAVGITSAVVVWTEPPTHAVPDKPRAPGPQPQLISSGEQRPRPVQAVAEQQRRRFRTLTGREGSRGPLRSRWLACRVQTAWHWPWGEPPGQPLWLLREWPTEEAEPTKYYRCHRPANLSLQRLVQTARGRWRVALD